MANICNRGRQVELASGFVPDKISKLVYHQTKHPENNLTLLFSILFCIGAKPETPLPIF